MNALQIHRGHIHVLYISYPIINTFDYDNYFRKTYVVLVSAYIMQPSLRPDSHRASHSVLGSPLRTMAYLPRIQDPSVFCDSSVFSDITSPTTSTLLAQDLLSTNEVTAKVQETKKTSSATAFPILPPAHNFSALGNPSKFDKYVNTQLPLAQAANIGGFPSPSPQCPSSEKAPNKINTNFLRDLLKNSYRQSTTEVVWVEKDVFQNEKLPVPFSEQRVA